MFIGHFGVALAAKPLTPRTSLGTLFAAAQLLDLIWPVFLLLGIERVRIEAGNTAFTPLAFVHYPWTHSLVLVLVWAALFGVGYRLLAGYGRGAWVVAGLVLSHWLLDFIVHRPDLPLAPGMVKVGFGLWNSVAATVIIEGLIFVAGVVVYVTTTSALNRTGLLALWGLVAFLIIIYVANVTGPPPPSAQAIGVVGLLTWLFIPWGAWVDRNRRISHTHQVVGSVSTR
jgi:hypothetical protein